MPVLICCFAEVPLFFPVFVGFPSFSRTLILFICCNLLCSSLPFAVYACCGAELGIFSVLSFCRLSLYGFLFTPYFVRSHSSVFGVHSSHSSSFSSFSPRFPFGLQRWRVQSVVQRYLLLSGPLFGGLTILSPRSKS